MSAGEQAIFPILFEFVRQQIHRSVVLIDEVDLNLHPPLAQMLLGLLPRLGIRPPSRSLLGRLNSFRGHCHPIMTSGTFAFFTRHGRASSDGLQVSGCRGKSLSPSFPPD